MPFTKYSLLDQSYLFHAISCHSSYKIHQLFTDYLLRLPSSELLEKRVFRSRANRRLVPMICGSGGSKSRLAKAAGAEPAGQRRDEKLHAVVARSRFPSQNAQNTPVSDHFWKLRCWKSARRCGTKHISKSKCTKHTRCGPLLALEMSKKCTSLWHEAHFQAKMYKTHHVRTTFWKLRCWKSARRCGAKHISKSKCTTTFGTWDVEKVHAVMARSTFPSQNVQNTLRSDHFWKLRCRKIARRCGAKHILKWTCTKHTSFGRVLEVEMSKKCTPLWREAHFQVKMLKALGVRTTFGRSDLVSRGRRKGLCTVSKVSKTWGFCSISKNDGRRGTLEEDLQRCISPGLAGAVQETCSSEMLGGQGADFLRGLHFGASDMSIS